MSRLSIREAHSVWLRPSHIIPNRFLLECLMLRFNHPFCEVSILQTFSQWYSVSLLLSAYSEYEYFTAETASAFRNSKVTGKDRYPWCVLGRACCQYFRPPTASVILSYELTPSAYRVISSSRKYPKIMRR